MNLLEISALQNEGNKFLQGKIIKEESACLIIHGAIAFPIITSYSYDKTKDIDVRLVDGKFIGKLKFLKNQNVTDIFSLPDEEFICFLTEYSKSSIVDSEYIFNNDYLLLDENYLTDYLSKNKFGSPIWGSFFHLDAYPSVHFSKKANLKFIEALVGIEINNPIYFENLSLSIDEPNPINRFLKLYHLLELQFDLHTAVLIKTLLDQGGKEKEISSKLRDYTKDEDERLESLIKERCKNLQRLVSYLNQVANYPSEAITIFYEYGKSKNPLKRTDFNQLIVINKKDFSKASVDALGGVNYDALIPKLAAYWIYRIRCCVAHNRFGEYILTASDEEFIVDFAEPLLKEVIIQCFQQ